MSNIPKELKEELISWIRDLKADIATQEGIRERCLEVLKEADKELEVLNRKLQEYLIFADQCGVTKEEISNMSHNPYAGKIAEELLSPERNRKFLDDEVD